MLLRDLLRVLRQNNSGPLLLSQSIGRPAAPTGSRQFFPKPPVILPGKKLALGLGVVDQGGHASQAATFTTPAVEWVTLGKSETFWTGFPFAQHSVYSSIQAPTLVSGNTYKYHFPITGAVAPADGILVCVALYVRSTVRLASSLSVSGNIGGFDVVQYTDPLSHLGQIFTSDALYLLFTDGNDGSGGGSFDVQFTYGDATVPTTAILVNVLKVIGAGGGSGLAQFNMGFGTAAGAQVVNTPSGTTFLQPQMLAAYGDGADSIAFTSPWTGEPVNSILVP